MARTLRSRSRTASISGARQFTLNGTLIGSPTTLARSDVSTCTDFVGYPVVDGTFNSTQTSHGCVLVGDAIGNPVGSPSVSNGVRFTNFPYPVVLSGVNAAEFTVPGGWYLDVVARSNPSRPVLTPATLLQDFVELPSMVKNIGDLLMKPKRVLSAKELANQNLAVQFGWLPLVRDLNQLLDLQALTLKRIRELHSLYTGKGLRKKITLNEDFQSGVYKERISLATGQYFDLASDIEVERKMWATIRWKPTTPPAYVPSDVALAAQARRIVLGLTSEGLAKGAWDVIPWTWMLGWFTNVGAYLLANSNTVPASHTSACLMNETKVTYTTRVVQSSNCNVDLDTGSPYIKTTKKRVLSGGLTPGFSVPFLSTFRLSILGSLYVQRFVR